MRTYSPTEYIVYECCGLLRIEKFVEVFFLLSFSGLEHGEYEWKDPETEDEVYAYWFILRE